MLDECYWPHHRELERKAREAHGSALIIDCHSFPSRPLPVDLDQTRNRPDFCLGTDPFHSPAELAVQFRSQLEGDGFRVELDHPYAGTLVPTFAWQKDPRVMSIMVEVNRRLYLVDEPWDISRGEDFGKIAEVLKRVVLSATELARLAAS